MTQRTITLSEVFTQAELQLAEKLLDESLASPHGTATDAVNAVFDQLTLPVISRINEVTKQQNDPKYWAYLLVHTSLRSRQGA